MMLTPCWPSAGPTGGDGFAFPAGSCSFTIPVTFFAIAPAPRGSSGPGLQRPGTSHSGELRFLDLHEIELDRGGAAEDGDQHPHAALVGVHFLDGAVEV